MRVTACASLLVTLLACQTPAPVDAPSVDVPALDVPDDDAPGRDAPDAPASMEDASISPSLAVLWIDVDGGTCTRRAPSEYDDASACTFQAAYDAAMAGDLVRIRPGSYGAVEVVGTGGPVTMAGAEGVVLGVSHFGASDLTIEDVLVDVGAGHAPGGIDTEGSDGLTLRGVRVHGANASMRLTGRNLRWEEGELGAPGTRGGPRACGGDTEPVWIQDADGVVIDRVTFAPQDADLTPLPPGCPDGFHLEMIRIDTNARNVVVRRSFFPDGDGANTSTIFITNVAGDPGDPTDLTFENNYFGGALNATFSAHTNVNDCGTYTIAFNTFAGAPGGPEVSGCATDGLRWIGNLAARPAYYACAGTHEGNVWQDDRTYECGSDVVLVGDRDATDLLGLEGDGIHLAAGSPAIDAVAAAGYCSTELGGIDREGGVRPTGAGCDAGADER